MTEPSSTPPEARVLEILRAPPSPPDGARLRVRARLLAAIPGPGGGGPTNGSGGAPLRGSRIGRVPLASVALLVGGAAGALLHAALSRPPPPAVVYVDRPIPVAVAPAPATLSSVAPSPEIAVAPSPASSATLSSAPSAGPSQLAAERAFLDRARADLVAGEPARALEQLAKHRRSFLNPILAEERDAMEVEALARAGRGAEARARAEAFEKKSPDSLFLPTVSSAIESIP
jgi:hypothetical protein